MNGRTTRKKEDRPEIVNYDRGGAMSAEERVVTLSEPQIQELIGKLKIVIDSATRRGLKIVAVGRTGVGKSSTINALMGKEVAPVGHFEPMTDSIEQYKVSLNGIPCVLADTPGLCEEANDQSNDSDLLK